MPFSIRPYRRLPLTVWSLIAFLLLSSGPVYAEWMRVATSDDGIIFFDRDTIRRQGELVKMWLLYDYKTTQNKAGDSFLSMSTQQQYDCAEERIRLLGYTWYSDNMGKGRVVYSDSAEGKWIPFPPHSINEALWKAACGKQ